MNLHVARMWFTPTSTCGILSINDVFFCYTVERQKFKPGMGKPYAISVGTYAILLQMSKHFNEITPHLQNVPDFTEIEIHPANWPSDLLGCTGVGSEHQEDYLDPVTGIAGGAVLGSRACFAMLMDKLKAATDPISITYEEIQTNA